MRHVKMGTESVPGVLGPCWFWTGPQMPNGYGKHRVRPGAPERATHRIMYEHTIGPVPKGMQLDHLCRNRICCNPAHLEPVTGGINTLRQDHAQRRKTHCPQGHDYTPDNTIRRNGRRFCRACSRERYEGGS